MVVGKTRKTTRRFGGEVFTLKELTSSKRRANSLAEDFRKKGHRARVTSSGRPVFYVVWIRKD